MFQILFLFVFSVSSFASLASNHYQETVDSAATKKRFAALNNASESEFVVLPQSGQKGVRLGENAEILAFGQLFGASPLYADQEYAFAIYPGDENWRNFEFLTPQPQLQLLVSVYDDGNNPDTFENLLHEEVQTLPMPFRGRNRKGNPHQQMVDEYALMGKTIELNAFRSSDILKAQFEGLPTKLYSDYGFSTKLIYTKLENQAPEETLGFALVLQHSAAKSAYRFEVRFQTGTFATDAAAAYPGFLMSTASQIFSRII